MRTINVTTASVADLVAYFAELGVGEDEAELRSAQATINRLVRRRFAVENELEARSGDQRRQLSRHFNHPNIQVQLNAATATLALLPAEARGKLEQIASWEGRTLLSRCLHAVVESRQGRVQAEIMRSRPQPSVASPSAG